MKILITGAAGFIGSHLAERLADLGHDVRGLDCLTDYYDLSLKEMNVGTIKGKGVTFLPLDLAVDDLGEAVRDVEFVYHSAAQPGISATSTFETYARNNITATHRLLEAVKESPTLRGFVNISTSSVYGSIATGSEDTEPKPTSYYGVTKLAAEQLALARARDKGFPACSLRLFSVYGPRERPDKLYPKLICGLLQDKPVPLFEGSEQHKRSYTYVDDIIDGFIIVLNHWDQCVGEIFNIGSDKCITTGEGIKIVEEVIGRQVKVDRKPRRAGDQKATHANIEKARRVLGYDPTTTPRQGLAKTVAWYRQHIVKEAN
jgi:nucleoside-diphosphate-sugar epimerase